MEGIETDTKYLKIINYKYKGVIGSEKKKAKILNKMFDKNAPVIVNLESTIVKDTIVNDTLHRMEVHTYPNFYISTMGETQKIDASIIEYFMLMKEQLASLIIPEYEYLETNWEFKGKKFKTITIVSNDHGGVVYDNIAYNIQSGHSTEETSITYIPSE